ncbi:MAG TPA: winged helix-turn-helix domain-containing protein [Blastocatellia bacterium]|nr:winged helix-turn-helix domain-containing protein [Blastocatellia bacterium]
MAVRLHSKYVLGEFELDADKYLLIHNNSSLHLPELPFQVLLYLVDNRERYVGRHELLEKFWQGSNGYEETLTKCISTIRTQLNDPANAPRYIETRKKVGYRYIGPFEQAPANSTSSEAPYVAVEQVRGISVSIEEHDERPLDQALVRAKPLSTGVRSVWRTKPAVVALASLLMLLVMTIVWLALRSRSDGHVVGGPNAPMHSIAVLPLKNLTGNPANDYFSDGMAESLITSLSKVEGLRVISRSSVFRFKDRDVSPQEIGTQLSVASVLEGNVRITGNSVHVAVRLVSVDDGRVLWVSDEKDHALGDVFVIQDEIARNVASGLRLQLSGNSVEQLAHRYTQNVEAYQLYLQGRFYMNNYGSNDDLLKAERYFDSAIEKDPGYALAYAGLADTYTTMAMDWRDPRAVFPKALEYAQKALELDDTLGEAHFARGAIEYYYQWDWLDAQRELDRALELDAKSVEGNACYLHSRETLGKTNEALAQVQHALDKNPLSTFISSELGCASYYAHRYNQAIELSRETLKTDPGYVLAKYNVARGLGQLRLPDQAIAELNTSIAAWGRTTMLLSELAYNYAASGKKAEARKLLDEMQKRSANEYVDPYPLAWVYVALSDIDKAFESLNRAYAVRSSWMPWVNVEPKFDPLHSDSRFQELLRRVHIG